MGLHDILADDQLFDRLLCIIVVGALSLGFVIRSFRKDDDL